MTPRSPEHSRRAAQGAVAFIAFGALTLAAAPAHADTGEVGYARAHIADDARIQLFGPRGGDAHGTYRYLDAYEDEIFADSRTSILVDVDTDELISRVLFEELRVELTEGDIEAMREAASGDVSQPGLENAEGSSEESVLHASFTGTTIETHRNWAGDEEFVHDAGESSVEVNEIGAEFSFVTNTSPWEESIDGTPLWGAHHSLELVVDFPEEGFSVTYGIGDTWVAGDLPPAEDGGDEGEEDDENEGGNEGDGGADTGDEDGGEGDTDPEESEGSGDGGDQDEQGGSDPEKDAEAPADEKPGKEDDLARTGVPVLGLIAAGTAIAAGGGAAAYLARRRKNSAQESETNTLENHEG